tara:strand:- start:3738 stop:4001 length:264 start_codon:yes stop_codon:yes gene_type:complete
MTQPFADYDALYEGRMESLKKKREEKFKQLDGDFFKALEVNDKASQTRIANKKNKFRDFPQEMEGKTFSSRDAIINYEPECFKNETM